MLEILSAENARSRKLGGTKNHYIPEGDFMKPMKINGGKNIARCRLGDLEARKDLSLLSRQAGFDFQLFCSVREILLENLNRNCTCIVVKTLCDQAQRALLEFGSSRVVGVEEDVGVEKYARTCHNWPTAPRISLPG
jgi:hypothetical protein